MVPGCCPRPVLLDQTGCPRRLRHHLVTGFAAAAPAFGARRGTEEAGGGGGPQMWQANVLQLNAGP